MAESSHNVTVRNINTSLRGPVADVFRSMMPDHSNLDGRDFYETVMDSGDLLHSCLMVFDKRRDSFRHLLVDAVGRPVSDDSVPLRCGRSLRDIVAMLLRTHAKRHFHAVLGGDPNDPKSRSGRLYRAINDYLLHQWQVPLVVHYTPLSPEMVERLGPALLDIKDVAELKRLRGAPLPKATVPLQQPATATVEPTRHNAPGGASTGWRTRDEGVWWDILCDPIVRVAVGGTTEIEMREMATAFAAVGEATRTRLMGQMSMSQSAVIFAACYRTLGNGAFQSTFAFPSAPAFAFASGLKRAQLGYKGDLRALYLSAASLVPKVAGSDAHPVVVANTPTNGARTGRPAAKQRTGVVT